MKSDDLYLDSLFQFEERVVITTGFFKGFKGQVLSVDREKSTKDLIYNIRLDKNRNIIRLNKDFIRKVWKVFNFEL